MALTAWPRTYAACKPMRRWQHACTTRREATLLFPDATKHANSGGEDCGLFERKDEHGKPIYQIGAQGPRKSFLGRLVARVGHVASGPQLGPATRRHCPH